jgi:hypothetical protein
MTENQTPLSSAEPAQTTLSQGNEQSPAVSQTQSEALPRPSWVSDEYYDPNRGVKIDELGAKFKELSEFKKSVDEQAQARKAEMPASAKDYGILPEGAKVPEGFNLDPDHPMWGLLQEISYEKGMTKKEYGDIATKFVERSIEANKQFIAKAEAERAEMFKQLGDNGAARIDTLQKWFRSSFGDQVGAQLSQTLFTPDIVKAMEKMQRSLSNQGVTSFNGLGRDQAGGGEIEGWDKMTFEQRWNARSQMDRRAS